MMTLISFQTKKMFHLLVLSFLLLTTVASAQLVKAKQDHIDLYTPEGIFNKSIYFDYYEKVEEMPQFPGGEEAWYKYIESNKKYPEALTAAGIEGTVLIRFIISPNGNIMNIKTLQSPPNGDLFVKEAQRLIQHMPRWTAGKLGGKTVYTEKVLPIVFSLK